MTTARRCRGDVFVLTAVAVVCATVLVACGGETKSEDATLPATTTVVPVSSSEAPSTPADSAPAETVGTAPTTIPATTPTTQSGPTGPSFEWHAQSIDSELARRVATTWRPDCPLPLDQLRLVQLNHFSFDGQVHQGELVLAADVVDSAEEAFARLFEMRFPIRQMKVIDEFDGDDRRSMAADNTSAFNCRVVSGTDRWSQHAYGRAIDLNTVENPWVKGSRVSPPEGAPFVDRSDVRPGMFIDGDPAVKAFTDNGWIWGGTWSNAKDYQHFSVTGQ